MLKGFGSPLTLGIVQSEKYAPLMLFGCNGFEPVEFTFGGCWKALSVRERKFSYIEYRSINSVYTIPVKRPVTDLNGMGGAYFEDQKYHREQYMKEKKRKLAAKGPGLRKLSASYFEQLGWLVQPEEDEDVIELNLDAPMLYAHGAISHY